MKEVAGTLDLILSTINADQDWGVYIQALAPHGHALLCGRSAVAGLRARVSAHRRHDVHQRQPRRAARIG